MRSSQVQYMGVLGMEAYPKYKDSGIEWISKIPEHWGIVQLRRLLVSVKNGSTAFQIDGPTKYPITRIETISEGIINYNKVGYVNREDANKEYILRENDILLSHINSFECVGNCAIYDGNRLLLHGMNLLRLRLQDKVHPIFLLYWLKSDRFLYSIQMVSKHAINQVSVPTSSLKSLPTPYPKNFTEQQAIANFLNYETSRIEGLVEKKQHFIELLDEKRSALISHTVTKGLDPDVSMRDSGIEWIGEIPEEWKVNKLKHGASINPNVLHENTDPEFVLKYIDIGNVGLGKMVDSPKEMKFKNAPSRARKVVQENDIIISTVRTYLKAVLHIINPEPNLIVSTGFAVLRPRSFVNHRYLFYLIRSNQFIYSVMAHSEGVSYPAINSSSLGDLPICYPSFSEQQAIASYLDRETAQIDTLIEKIKQSIEYLKEYRTALISNAVTGKIDVRGISCEQTL